MRCLRELLGSPLEHPQSVWIAKFSSDSQFVLTSSSDGVVREWDISTGRLTGRQLQHPCTPWEAEFSADNELVLTGCGPSAGSFGEARLWKINSATNEFAALRHFGAVAAVAFSPDNSTILTGGTDDTARLWTRTESLAGSLPQIQAWVGMITGLKLDARGVARPLDPGEMEKLNRDLYDFEPYLSATRSSSHP